MGTRELDDGATAQQLRHQIESERDQLVTAVDSLRRTATPTHLTRAVEHRLPAMLGGAFVTGFVVAGGVGGAVRVALSRRRERRRGDRAARLRSAATRSRQAFRG